MIFLEVRDEAIEVSVHQCGPNFKATSTVNYNDLFYQVTQFNLCATMEVLKGCKLDSPRRAEK